MSIEEIPYFKRDPELFKKMLEAFPVEVANAFKKKYVEKCIYIHSENLDQIADSFIENFNTKIHNWWIDTHINEKVNELVKASDESTATSPCYRPTTGVANIQGIEEHILRYKNDKLLENLNVLFDEVTEKENKLQSLHDEYQELFDEYRNEKS